MTDRELTQLNDELSAHMRQIERCTFSSDRYGRLILATPPETRYHYVYPRDSSCAVQFFRRLIVSPNRYDAAGPAYELMGNMARFMKDVQSPKGHWGQRYSPDGEDKAIYKQEDNVAHGIAILCNYLLTVHHRKEEIPDLEGFLEAIRRAMDFGINRVFRKELNLFYSTTSIHESAMEEGFTCWVNFAYLHAFNLAEEVFRVFDHLDILPDDYFEFPKHFYYSARELFMSGNRYVRRIGPRGNVDLRPDFTLLSPFYFGFVDYKTE
ncbi:MAG TPA: hypothetical protein VLB09_05540, partial [Nitrospiria bacterium]|nr:hypothetical protein [Nitrospiria bacterium]